jgi:hypothetical protein
MLMPHHHLYLRISLVIADEVPTVDVISVAVAVVVDAVSSFSCVDPDVGSEVWVGDLCSQARRSGVGL